MTDHQHRLPAVLVGHLVEHPGHPGDEVVGPLAASDLGGGVPVDPLPEDLAEVRRLALVGAGEVAHAVLTKPLADHDVDPEHRRGDLGRLD